MVLPTTDLGDWPMLQTHEVLACNWTNTANANVDLTGATITLRIAPQSNPSAGRNGTGIVSGQAGNSFNYQFGVSDFALGRQILQFMAVWPDGTKDWSQVMSIRFVPVI